MVSRPLVVITGRRLEGDGLPWSSAAYSSPQGYADALARAGARPVVLPPVAEGGIEAAAWLDGVGGVVLAGGADVDSAVYGEPPHPAVYGVDRIVDDLELGLLRAALDRRLPVLAVCRGLQLLNVAFGGTLHQHLVGMPGLTDHGHPTERIPAHHDVSVVPGSRLAEALGVSATSVASIHHQAIARVADALMVTAVAPDGVVEALEPRGLGTGWVVGVQWHPEWSPARDPIQQRLFAAFVEQARRSAVVAPLS